jgi:hypothetical protein
VAQFGMGLIDKTIKGHKYTYFWTYDGYGRKQEVYCGRSGELRTQRKALKIKLQHLQKLGEQIQRMIAETCGKLDRLPAEVAKV